MAFETLCLPCDGIIMLQCYILSLVSTCPRAGSTLGVNIFPYFPDRYYHNICSLLQFPAILCIIRYLKTCGNITNIFPLIYFRVWVINSIIMNWCLIYIYIQIIVSFYVGLFNIHFCNIYTAIHFIALCAINEKRFLRVHVFNPLCDFIETNTIAKYSCLSDVVLDNKHNSNHAYTC